MVISSGLYSFVLDSTFGIEMLSLGLCHNSLSLPSVCTSSARGSSFLVQSQTLVGEYEACIASCTSRRHSTCKSAKSSSTKFTSPRCSSRSRSSCWLIVSLRLIESSDDSASILGSKSGSRALLVFGKYKPPDACAVESSCSQYSSLEKLAWVGLACEGL